MSVGTANGITFTLRDLEGIVTAFDALGLSGRVPIKFGHNDEQPLTDGQPALGWIGRLFMQGDILKADATDMPTSVYEMVKAGLYKFVSVELLKNVLAGTRTIPWVLDAVALLGADQPAFGNLKDLQSLTLKRKPALQARARVAFKRDKFTFTGATKAMDEKEVQAAITAAVAKSTEELTAKFTKQLTDEVAKVQATAKAEADARVAKAQAESHRAQIKAKFEHAVKAEALQPAKRESFYKYNRVDDDAAVTQIKLEDVDAYIEEFGDKAKLSRDPATKKGQEPNEDEKGLRADQILALRADKLCYSRQQDPRKGDHYSRAVVEVLRSDPKLAEAYKYMPDTEYRQAS
jgi:hypothetical protein